MAAAPSRCPVCPGGDPVSRGCGRRVPWRAAVLLLSAAAASAAPTRSTCPAAPTRSRTRTPSQIQFPTSWTWCRSPASGSPTSRSAGWSTIELSDDWTAVVTVDGRPGRRPAGQRGGDHPAVLPAGREVRRAGARRATRPPPAALTDDALITLDRTNRNVEVEELLGALSLVLNGGGLAQLQTINPELGDAPGGPRGRGQEHPRASWTPSSAAWTAEGPRSTGRWTASNELAATLAAAHRARSPPRWTPSAPVSTSSTSSATCSSSMLDGLARLGDVGTRVINEAGGRTPSRTCRLAAADPTQLAAAGPDLAQSLELHPDLPLPGELPVGAALPARTAAPAGCALFTNMTATVDLDLPSCCAATSSTRRGAAGGAAARGGAHAGQVRRPGRRRRATPSGAGAAATAARRPPGVDRPPCWTASRGSRRAGARREPAVGPVGAAGDAEVSR